MKPDEIIDHIDEWLDEHSWRMEDTEIDFALDIRRLIEQLDSVELAPSAAS